MESFIELLLGPHPALAKTDWIIYNRFFWRAYSFAPRCAVFCVLSLSLNKESTKENQLKGLMPLRNPQDFSLSLSFGGYQKALWRQQFLRNEIQRFRCYCKQAIISHFIPCRASKQIEEKNIYIFFLHLSPHIHHARQAKEARAFLLEILLNWGASQIAKTFASSLACVFRVCKFL